MTWKLEHDILYIAKRFAILGGVRPGMWEIKNAMVLCDDNIVLKEAVAVTGLHEDSYGGAYMRLRAKTAAEETVYDLGFIPRLC